MLNLIKNHLETISGIEIYPLISFVIFTTFFAVMAWWVLKADKKHINNMSNLPLE